MKKNIRLFELSIVVMAALALSAFQTMIARADDGTLQSTATPAVTQNADANAAASNPTDAAVVTADPAGTSATQEAATAAATTTPADPIAAAATQEAVTETSTEATATATPVAPDTTQEAPTAAATEVAPAPENSTASPDAGSEKAGAPLSQIPDGTDVVLLDTTGNPVDAGSAEAADIIAHGDPVWCPTGVAPKPLTAGCTDSFPLFNSGLIPAMKNKAVNGTIWIKYDYNSSGEGPGISLDSIGLGTTANFALTLQGGWNGTPGSTGVSGNSTFNVPLSINWNADVTLNNITVTSAGGSPALGVTTPKNITLTNVTVSANIGTGAVLDNTAGSGNVTVTNSDFENNNSGGGLNVSSDGTITLSGVTASGNVGTGAVLNNAAGSGNVTITNGDFESNQSGSGFNVLSKGTITLSGVTANGNTANGAVLNNTAGSGNVTVTNGDFEDNQNGNGLNVSSDGTITLSGVKADGNRGDGAYLDNSTAATAKSVTLSGVSNEFDSNSVNGLDIESEGAISLKDIDAVYNSNSGVYLKNTYLAAPQAITLTGTNVLSGNSYRGLEAYSNGPITANNLMAIGNVNWGVYLNNGTSTAAQPVTITGTLNQLKFNQAGLFILSNGNITLNSVIASNNTGDPGDGISGVQLNDCNSNGIKCVGTGNISLTGTNVIDNNYATGLQALSTGTITINNLSADGNGKSNANGSGAILINTYAAVATPKSITLTGVNSFSGNYQYGLDVFSNGAFAASNITANENRESGVFITNSTASSAQPITITGVNSFSSNTYEGLYAITNGAVAVSNITASGNGNDGVSINNSTAPSAQPITISGVNTFINNTYSGLFTVSKGAISVSNITANWNREYGVSLSNTAASAAQPITISGVNSLNDNTEDGLYAHSNGAITGSNITSVQNGIDGAEIDNSGAATPQPVTITGTNAFNLNGGDGLNILSKGAVALSSTSADENGTNLDNPSLGHYQGFGVTINNAASTASHPAVTITGTNQFNSNWFDGLKVLSYGAISVSGITANYNGTNSYAEYHDGVVLDNCLNSGGVCADPAAEAITIMGTNQFNNNPAVGLWVLSSGAITANNIDAENDLGSCGALLNNSLAATAQAVSLTGTNLFKINVNDGLDIYSKGAISASNITAVDNGFVGANINNTYAAAAPYPSVTIGGTNIFNHNSNDGLIVSSEGAIAVSNITANQDFMGADIENTAALSAQPITISGTNTFNNNSNMGLDAVSNGPITASNITAGGNGNCGAQIINTSAATAQPVTITGVNSFTSNTANGLAVSSKGAISVSSITASSNHGYGADIENTSNPAAQTITITGINYFNGNSYDGLHVASNGAVAASNLHASLNVEDGANINNSNAAAPQPVTISGTNSFSNNGENGLYIYTKGADSMSNVTANSNGQNHDDPTSGHYTGHGVLVNNNMAPTSHQAVTMSGTNQFEDNWFSGLIINSYGAITLNNVTSIDNGAGGYSGYGEGVYLDNCAVNGSSCQNTAAEPINITGTNVFSNDPGNGLNAYSSGAFTLSSVTAKGDGWNSVIPANDGGSGVLLDNSRASGAQGITLTGINTFTGNYYSGLVASSNGAITASSITASQNGSFGANLNNSGAAAAPSITLTGTNTFNNNTYDGLFANSVGAITASNVTANANGLDGIDLENYHASAPQAISLTGANTASHNGQTGLYAESRGAVSIGSLTAGTNVNNGAFVNNLDSTSSSPQNVTFTGTSVLNQNGYSGLVITTYGAITINNLTANSNGTRHINGFGWGAYLDTCNYSGGVCSASALAKAITLTGTNTFNSNFMDGIWATAKGPVSINSLTADTNSADGANLNNQWGAGSAGGITLTGSNAFLTNSSVGLVAFSNGAISGNNITASENSHTGADISAVGVLNAPENVTLTGANIFLNNGDHVAHNGDGLSVSATGNIAINNLTASENAVYGANLDACVNSGGCIGTGSITLTGINTFYNNDNDGLYMESNKNITVSNFTADKNGGVGVYGWANGAIVMLSGGMSGNTSYGWELGAGTTVTLKGVLAYGNNGGTGDTNKLSAIFIIVRTYP